MATNVKSAIPSSATHPGEVLKRELQERNLKQKDFANIIGMAPSNLSALIKGKRNVTKEIALKLEDACGVPFQVWMNLQANYDYDVARLANKDKHNTDTKSQLVINIDDVSILPHLKSILNNLKGVSIANP